MNVSFEACDAAASFLLAACAVYRARIYGHHTTGAMLLGCLVGLASPILRDILLGLPASLAMESMLLPAVCGGGCGIAVSRWNRYEWPFFRWSDTASLALAATAGCAKALLCGGSPVVALLTGVAAGSSGGLIRDVTLGDTVLAIEQDFYITALVLGLIVEIAIWHFLTPSILLLLGGPCVLIIAIRLFVVRLRNP